MTKRQHTPAYPAELRESGIRLFRENRVNYSSYSAACKAIAPKLGYSPDSLRIPQWPLEQLKRHPGSAGQTCPPVNQNAANLSLRNLELTARMIDAGTPTRGAQ